MVGSNPILHGLCTFGITARAASKWGKEIAEMGGRFTAPVFPGDTLTVKGVQREQDVALRVIAGDNRECFKGFIAFK